MAEYKRFSDFAEKEDNRLGGDKRHLDDILNVEILIKAYRVMLGINKSNVIKLVRGT